MSNGRPNRLINETSPYLLQHAYNPVEWFPWGEEALQKAKEEDKPIILSIGYSACHWCHVMEHECFEKESIATIMNRHFVCIKVDREERPDVDQVYMEAIQAMGIHGGWPLNVILTPEQKPFYGGTYFPPKNWVALLENVAEAFKAHRKEIDDSAEKFAEHLGGSVLPQFNLAADGASFTMDDLAKCYDRLAAKFDETWGGMKKAPKFPMPSIWLFVLRYAHLSGNAEALNHVLLTLTKMAHGGIHDQVGGGFARYSVDGEWFAPHFEKMLYDNAQLISLYAEAWQKTKEPLLKQVVYETIEWLQREMLDAEGGFYAALDADSEGVEGKFYTWTAGEFKKVAGDNFAFLSDYYGVTNEGNWEHGRNILAVTELLPEVAKRHQLDAGRAEKMASSFKKDALSEREGRVRPGLDDKILTGWNGLLVKGLCDAGIAFKDDQFVRLAEGIAAFIKQRVWRGGVLHRSYKKGEAKLYGYLEDYAAVIDGAIRLYEATFKEEWLLWAQMLTEKVLEEFYDVEEQLFFYTSSKGEALIARKKEVFDNVIPATNSMMAMNLHKMGLFLENNAYLEMAEQMVGRLKNLIVSEPDYLTNWAILATHMATPTAEVAIVGKGAPGVARQLQEKYLPNKIVAASENGSHIPVLAGKPEVNGKAAIYVCYNRTCQKPVNSVEEAVAQMIGTEG